MATEKKKSARAIKSAAPRRRRANQVPEPPKLQALFSVFDKTGVVELAAELVRLGYRAIASGGTAKKFRQGKVRCTEVSKVTGSPEILNGRVKTIHPVIAAGILAMRKPTHEAQLKRLGIDRIQIVVCNLYPFALKVASGASHFDVVENIDIGGVLLLREAAKNADEGVTVLCDPADYDIVLKALQEHGEVPLEMRRILAQKAFETTALYDAAIATYLAGYSGIVPTQFLALKPIHQMRKAENGCQDPSWLCQNLLAPADDPLAWPKWQFIEGNPGHVNLCGADSALRVMCRLAEAYRRNFNERVPYIVIACKHGNPSGLGVDWDDPNLAIERAMGGEPGGDGDAVMGAEIMCNFVVEGEKAIRVHTVLKKYRKQVKRDLWGPDVVCAAGFSEGAVSLLSTRATGRHLLANLAMLNPTMSPQDCEVRLVRGGALVQGPADFIFDRNRVQEWLGDRPLDDDELATFLIAWAVAWEGVSNSVTLAKKLALIGTGLGQQDRRGATKLALTRAEDAGHDPKGAFFASDGFFPFATSAPGELPEAIEMLIVAGCIGGVVPADGKRWQEVRGLILRSGMVVAALGKQFRGFAKH